MATGNVHEERNRAAKVRAIVDHISDRLTSVEMSEPGRTTLLEGMRASDQSLRDEVARRAGQRSPSEATWALVVHGVEERIDWLARGQQLRALAKKNNRARRTA